MFLADMPDDAGFVTLTRTERTKQLKFSRYSGLTGDLKRLGRVDRIETSRNRPSESFRSWLDRFHQLTRSPFLARMRLLWSLADKRQLFHKTYAELVQLIPTADIGGFRE